MPEVIGALASDFGDSASGGGVMPASPQNSALDNTSNGIRHIGCHVWMPLDKDVIDQVLNAALAKMTTSTEGDKSADQKDCKISEGGKLKNDLKIYNKETASLVSMDENKNSKLKNKENVQDHVNSLNVNMEPGPSLLVNDICAFAASRKRASTPDSGVSDSRSSGSPILNDGWVPVPRSALDTLIASEFDKFEEHESQNIKTQSSTENRVQTVTENSSADLDHYYNRDQPSRTNPNFSHSSPMNVNRNTSVIVSRQPDKETAAASLPKDNSQPSQLNVTTIDNQKCRPAEHTAKEDATDNDTSSCTTDSETPSWVMVQKATLENMVESAMIKGTCDKQEPAKKADIAKLPVKSKPAVKQSESSANKKLDGSNTIKKRINTKQKRSAVPSQIYSKRPRISEAPAMPYPPPPGMYGRVNTLQELLQPEADLSVHSRGHHPLTIPQYQMRFTHPHLQPPVLPGMNRLPVPPLLPMPEYDGVPGSAFRPPVTTTLAMPTENHPVPKRSPTGGQSIGESTPLDLSQKETSLTTKPPVARPPDNNNSAMPAVHRAAPSALVNNVNGMPVNNQSVLYEPAASSGGVGSVHNTQAKAIRLSAESAPTAPGKEVRKASPRPEEMGTSSPRGSPWVVLDINQVDHIFDRVLQEEHSPVAVSQGADQINDDPASSGVEKATQGSKGESMKDIPPSPVELEDDKNSDSAKEDVASIHSDCFSSPQLNGIDERESSPGFSGGSSAGGPSSPKQGSPGGSGFKWKSDLLRKFNGGTDDSDSSSPREHSPSPAPSLPPNTSFTSFLGDNQNNNIVIPETNKRQGRNKKKKSKKGTKKQSNSR